MTKPSIGLQDLRRRIYLKAKADQKWRFWGLYVHVCKPETLREAYEMARRNGGAAGIDGVTFAAIEEAGLEAFLDDIHDELHSRTYRPSANRQVEIPKDGGNVRILGIPTIRDRVVQGALKLILEPVFEADFQEGSYGYRPKRTAHRAVHRVTTAVVKNKTTVITSVPQSQAQASASCGRARSGGEWVVKRSSRGRRSKMLSCSTCSIWLRLQRSRRTNLR